jgi:hypothetical protein
MTSAAAVVIGGVNAHKHSHDAAAVGGNGRLPGDREFPANERGYAVARVVAGRRVGVRWVAPGLLTRRCAPWVSEIIRCRM